MIVRISQYNHTHFVKNSSDPILDFRFINFFYNSHIMQLDHQDENIHIQNQPIGRALKLDIDIVPIEDHYLMEFKAKLDPLYANTFVKQSFILFVLQLRTGMSQRGINVLRGCILEFCQEALEKGLNGFGFFINGEYFTIKKPNYEAIKEILTMYMNISKEDNYLTTLRKLRHVLQNQIQKYGKIFECIDIIFFTSYVEIDHSLGVKKRSYIDQLNQHSEKCSQEVDRLYITLEKYKKYNVHIIGLEKRGYKDEDYSLIDRDLFYKIHTKLGKTNAQILLLWIQEQDLTAEVIFNLQTHAYRPVSFTKLIQGFRSIASTVLAGSVSFAVEIPIQSEQIKQKYSRCFVKQNDYGDHLAHYSIFYQKKEINLNKIKNNGVLIDQDNIKNRLQEKQIINQGNPHGKFYSVSSTYTQHGQKDISTQITNFVQFYNFRLTNICQDLKNQIISYKRIYQPNSKSRLQMIVDQEKQLKLREQIFYIEKRSKQIYEQIFNPKLFPAQNQIQSELKRKAFQKYSSLKKKLDIAQQVMVNISKKQIKNDQIGKISQAVTFWGIKNSLKNKLIRRINLNPKMIDQTYAKIHQITTNTNYTSLQTLNNDAKHAVGYCVKSGINFATALRNEDCFGVLIEVERPDSAIADPGRVRIRQISPFTMSVSNFFNVYHYGIDSLGKFNQEKGGQWIREYAKLDKENYQEMWDYWGLVEKKYTVTALVPVFICKEHWEVAKLLMKPCLGFLATGQPLGYTFSQAQNIPFMVLSFAIRRVQEITYEIQTLQAKFERNQFLVTEFSQLQRKILTQKVLLKRMKDLCWVMEETCYQIMKDMSGETFEEKLSEIVIQKYLKYIESPIDRTIDIISNNSAFLSQIYCVIKLQLLKKPEQKQFNEFFKRLVEEQLRRQTDGWNEEETQDKFINKLLNCQTQKMDAPEYVILDSAYYDQFEQLKNGKMVHKTYFQITRDQLAMMVTKNGKFNDTQRLLLIQYKRLYENRVIWMWYIRFRLYQEIERIQIHKWKCLDLQNSYMLFTMIIQNKKQRKNSKRREAIMRHEYVDPFNYERAREFLELEFMRLRGNKERQNIKILNNKKYGNAASTFAQSPSLEQAAGTLINFDVGQQCRIFFEEIERGSAVRVQQKLHMILLGEYKGVQLFRGWKMSKQKSNRLRKVYPQVFERYGYLC